MKLKGSLFSAVAVALLVAAASIAGEVRNAAGFDEDSAKHDITAKDLKQRLDKGDKIVIIDARSNLNGQIVKGAIQVPGDKLEEWAKTADKKAVIVTYCTCPHDESAESEMRKLRAWGFENVFSLTGGLDAARAAGIEVVAPN